MIKKIVIIGSGNVATRFALEFKKVNIKILQIISRNKNSGQNLAKKVQALFSTNFDDLIKSDLILICVNDDNIKLIVKKLPNLPMVHTSGNKSMSILDNRSNCGVIYPLQTLNKDDDVNFKTTPICIESNNSVFENDIFLLCRKISNKVCYLNSEKRKYLHLSAVIASNFSNFCYHIAKKQLDDKNIDFELIKPLILETANKIFYTQPESSQTGPAARGDKRVIKEHLEMLKDDNYKKIYKLLSESILKAYGK